MLRKTNVVAAIALALATSGSPASAAPSGGDAPLAPPNGVAADGSVEVIVVRSEPAGAARETPVIAGSGTTFSDCPLADACPEMLVVPSSLPGLVLGEVTLAEPEKRLHGVTIKAFAITRTEVTVAQYERCVAAGACHAPEWREPGSQFNVDTGANPYYRNLGANLSGPDFPIVGVSYDDAVAFADWLSKQTHRDYRLPSETEWEYAARAGTFTQYWWGDEPSPGGKAMAACRGCGSEWDARSIAPAASFGPNAWGLHDTSGNVWEWVADYYCADFSRSPADGTPRATDDCAQKDGDNLRVLRGGSSFYEPRFMRSAARLRNFNTFRNFSVGFRVARTLLP